LPFLGTSFAGLLYAKQAAIGFALATLKHSAKMGIILPMVGKYALLDNSSLFSSVNSNSLSYNRRNFTNTPLHLFSGDKFAHRATFSPNSPLAILVRMDCILSGGHKTHKI